MIQERRNGAALSDRAAGALFGLAVGHGRRAVLRPNLGLKTVATACLAA